MVINTSVDFKLYSIFHLSAVLIPGAIFTKTGLIQVLGLIYAYKYSEVRAKIWLKPFVNMPPGIPVLLSWLKNYFCM